MTAGGDIPPSGVVWIGEIKVFSVEVIDRRRILMFPNTTPSELLWHLSLQMMCVIGEQEMKETPDSFSSPSRILKKP